MKKPGNLDLFDNPMSLSQHSFKGQWSMCVFFLMVLDAYSRRPKRLGQWWNRRGEDFVDGTALPGVASP